MFKKSFPLVVALFMFAVIAACSSAVPSTPAVSAAATAAPPPTQPPQQTQQPQPAPPPVYSPNCAGCIQLSKDDTMAIILAQRAMMSLQGEWQEQVKGMNTRFAVQQKVISDKLDDYKKNKKVPANFVFDYQNVQFVPAPKDQRPSLPVKPGEVPPNAPK